MMIKVKIDNVEIVYEQETLPTEYTAACAEEDWNGGHNNTILLKTIATMCQEAKKLHEGQFDDD